MAWYAALPMLKRGSPYAALPMLKGVAVPGFLGALAHGQMYGHGDFVRQRNHRLCVIQYHEK